jgi:hypothetical protein
MSGPIQKPNVDNIVQNTQPVNEHEQELTKVTEVAIGTLGSPRLPTPSLDPARVKLAVSKSFEWCWNFKKENDHLIWQTNLDQRGEWPDRIIDDINEEQFPVTQPTYEFLKDLFLIAKEKDSVDFLAKMGFSYQDGEFKTPTREQLVINYNGYQEKHPKFPKLVFRMVDKILEPDKFISLVLETDFILSDGQELIHDYTYHIIPTLIGIFQAPESYRFYKDLLGKTVRTVLDFLKKDPSEIVTELNKHLKPLVDEQFVTNTVATLKFMVGAALDLLTAEIWEYDKIIKEEAKGVKELFFKAMFDPLKGGVWEKPLKTAVPTLQEDFLENYPTSDRWEGILHAMFIAAGLR